MKSLILTAALSALALATGTQLLGAQSIQTRPAAEVRLSPDPVLSVGMLDGPDEYLFGEINAGAVLDDGSVVLSDQMNFRIQRFGQDGEHLWSRGREGEGPGEFQRVQIVNGCASANRIVIYDIWTQRVLGVRRRRGSRERLRFLVQRAADPPLRMCTERSPGLHGRQRQDRRGPRVGGTLPCS